VQKQDLLEDLTMRIKSIRLSTPGGGRGSSYAASSRQSLAPASMKTSSLDIPASVSSEVERQLDRAEKRSNIKVKSARTTQAASGSAVRSGDLPLPGKVDISKYIRQDEPKIKQEPDVTVSTPTTDIRGQPQVQSTSILASGPTIASPSPTPSAPASAPTFPASFNLNAQQPSSTPSFGSFKLSLDPGDLSSSHSRGRASTPGTRTHHPAPRINVSAASLADDKPSSAGLSFFPPPSGSKQDGGDGKGGSSSNSPKGFFSLSGFGQK